MTAMLAKPLVRTPYFAMVNLIAEKQVVPELVQDDFTPEKVAAETLRLLQDPNARTAMKDGLGEVRRRLGPPGAVERAAVSAAFSYRGRRWQRFLSHCYPIDRQESRYQPGNGRMPGFPKGKR